MDWMKVFRTAEISGATSSVWLWLILVFAIFIKSSSAEQINISAAFGKSVTLPCRVLDGNKTINGLEWSKPELETEYVLLYRDGHLGLFNQHPSFKDRVDLKDRQMKDGDVSLILKNVTTADAGIYEVRKIPETKRRKRANLGGDPICIINLSVVDPPGQTGGDTEDGGKEDRGKEDGPYALATGLSVAVVMLAVAIFGGLLIYTRYRKQNHQDTNELEKLDSSSSPSLDSLDNGSQTCKETAVVVLI